MYARRSVAEDDVAARCRAPVRTSPVQGRNARKRRLLERLERKREVLKPSSRPRSTIRYGSNRHCRSAGSARGDEAGKLGERLKAGTSPRLDRKSTRLNSSH